MPVAEDVSLKTLHIGCAEVLKVFAYPIPVLIVRSFGSFPVWSSLYPIPQGPYSITNIKRVGAVRWENNDIAPSKPTCKCITDVRDRMNLINPLQSLRRGGAAATRAATTSSSIAAMKAGLEVALRNLLLRIACAAVRLAVALGLLVSTRLGHGCRACAWRLYNKFLTSDQITGRLRVLGTTS